LIGCGETGASTWPEPYRARRSAGFCILTSGRTGSYLLVELLDSQPKIRCDGEIFAAWRDFPVRLVKGRQKAVRLRGAQAYGFKINTLFLSARFLAASPKRGGLELIRHLRDDGVMFLHLRRRNLMRQAVSTMRGEDHGFLHRDDAQIFAGQRRSRRKLSGSSAQRLTSARRLRPNAGDRRWLDELDQGLADPRAVLRHPVAVPHDPADGRQNEDRGDVTGSDVLAQRARPLSIPDQVTQFVDHAGHEI